MVNIINEQINAEKVFLVIDVNGINETIGEVSLDVALKKASTLGLDLVQMNGNDIPVVKVLDYSKMLYKIKKSKNNKKNKIESKELGFRPNTAINDINRLIKQANKFIENGDHVKFVVKFRGRETQFNDNVVSNFNHIINNIKLPKGFSVKYDNFVKNDRMILMISR